MYLAAPPPYSPPVDTIPVLLCIGLVIVIVFMGLILWRRVTPMVALIGVPLLGGLVAGLFTQLPVSLGDLVLGSLKDMAGTVALLMFAIMFFGTMIAAGLFDPIVRGIVRIAGNDPLRVVVGTAVLTAIVSLDGDGSTTFVVVTSALVPVYLRLGLSPVVLTVVAALINGVLNVLPWGGPTARAATALGVDTGAIFVPMIPALIVGLVLCFVFAVLLGLGERRRLGAAGMTAGTARVGLGIPLRTRPAGHQHAATRGTATTRGEEPELGLHGTLLAPDRPTLRPRLYPVNAVLTVAVIATLIAFGDSLPIWLIFMCGTALALVINYPKVHEQQEIIVSQASSIVAVTSMVLAASVLVGVMSGTGMVMAIAQSIIQIIPDWLGPGLAVITGVLSMPLTFFMSNDAFYYGILPILNAAAGEYGITPVEMARASITGQPMHMQSPLVPATLLLLSLSGVSLAQHHRRVLWRAALVCLAMLATGILTGVIPLLG